MLDIQLKQKEVRSIFVDNANYFYVQDIKDKCPELKVDVDKIIYIDKTPLVKSEDVYPMTDFDKIIAKTLRNYRKPKK